MVGRSRQTWLRFGAGSHLALAHEWFCRSGSRELAMSNARLEEKRLCLPRAGMAWKEKNKRHDLLFEYEVFGGDVAGFSVRVTNLGRREVALRLVQEVTGLPLRGKVFAPSGTSFYDLGRKAVCVGYRDCPAGMDSLSIPVVTLFDEKADIGYTIAGHLEMPIAPFRVEVTDKGRTVRVHRRISHLRSGESITVQHHFLRHAGCWRPGLAWLRRTYPHVFMLPRPGPTDVHGCFTYSNVGDKALCRELAAEGVRNLEIHWTYPHLGKYVPEEDPWIPAIDDKWSYLKRTPDPKAPPEDSPYETIKKYMMRAVRSVGTAERVRRFIRDLKSAGIRSYIYFQATECWEFFALTHFPEAIRRRPDGRPVLTWFDHVQVDCRPETRWGRYITGQLEQLLDLYPDVDGVFMDQAGGDWDHDGHTVCRISDHLGRIVRRRGKLLYWNGPYQVELLEHATGMLAEGGSVQGEELKYLTIGNKVCCGLGKTEPQYQWNLLNGIWPSVPSQVTEPKSRFIDGDRTVQPIPPERDKLHVRYMPLFELYRGKTWVLEPHPIRVPAGIQANLFERPNGDYLMPLVVPGHNVGDGQIKKNLTVTINASGVARVKAVYARLPDVRGTFSVPWNRQGRELRIRLPWIGSAALLWLAGKARRVVKTPPLPRPGRTAVPAVAAPIRAYVGMEAVIPTGSTHGSGGRISVPAPVIPKRTVLFNGREGGVMDSRNYRDWRQFSAVLGFPNFRMDWLRKVNEVVIIPDGPNDFFKMRNMQMTIRLPDGKVLQSKMVRRTYSSCRHPQAEGIIGSPVRIKFVFPEWKRRQKIRSL